jgi:mannosyltransferase OCH1-like enzyme
MQAHTYDFKCVSAPWVQPYLDKGLEPWVYIDFDTSMQSKLYAQEIDATKQVIGIDSKLLYHSLRGLYNKNNLSNIIPSKILRIPKIIHQILLGDHAPECFKEFMQSWIDNHLEGWTYMLWTEKEIGQLHLHNKYDYDATDNYAVKSYIARLEILYQMGGVYIDSDFESLKPLDILHYTYDFYVGIQALDSKFLQLGTGIIGSCAGHPILKHSIETIKDDGHKKGAPRKIGPIHLTKSFFMMSDLYGNIDIALPASYFYPLAYRKQSPEKGSWLANGAYGVHW